MLVVAKRSARQARSQGAGAGAPPRRHRPRPAPISNQGVDDPWPSSPRERDSGRAVSRPGDRCHQGIAVLVGAPGPSARRRDRRARRTDRDARRGDRPGSSRRLRRRTGHRGRIGHGGRRQPRAPPLREPRGRHLCGVAPVPAGSGKTTGSVKTDGGGDRQANSALWRIVMVRIAHDPDTKVYVERRVKRARPRPRSSGSEALRRPRGLSLPASRLTPRADGSGFRPVLSLFGADFQRFADPRLGPTFTRTCGPIGACPREEWLINVLPAVFAPETPKGVDKR